MSLFIVFYFEIRLTPYFYRELHRVRYDVIRNYYRPKRMDVIEILIEEITFIVIIIIIINLKNTRYR